VKFRLLIDGAERRVVAGADGGLALDDDAWQAKVSQPSDDRRLVQVGDKSYEVRVVESCTGTGPFILELAGERIPVTVSGVSKGGEAVAGTAGTKVSAEAAGAAGAAGVPGAASAAAGPVQSAATAVEGEGIWAPMPGKIVNVLVEPGVTVEEGDPVLILEAMKMENELRAPKKATVASVMVTKGDQVERGQLLVTFD
jgi:biotin carboxyl carrier protein